MPDSIAFDNAQIQLKLSSCQPLRRRQLRCVDDFQVTILGKNTLEAATARQRAEVLNPASIKVWHVCRALSRNVPGFGQF
ncbi:MAG: hypothetical protein U0521_13725 [Anaerolineae bacterium]